MSDFNDRISRKAPKESKMIEKKSKNSTGIKGGARPGAGRKPGIASKKNAALQKAVEESGITPLQYMLDVMRSGDETPRDRLAAAQAAAPYVHAKLSSVEVSGKDGAPIESVTRIELVAMRGNPTD